MEFQILTFPTGDQLLNIHSHRWVRWNWHDLRWDTTESRYDTKFFLLKTIGMNLTNELRNRISNHYCRCCGRSLRNLRNWKVYKNVCDIWQKLLNPKNVFAVAQQEISSIRCVLAFLWTLEQCEILSSTLDPTLTFKVPYFKVRRCFRPVLRCQIITSLALPVRRLPSNSQLSKYFSAPCGPVSSWNSNKRNVLTFLHFMICSYSMF